MKVIKVNLFPSKLSSFELTPRHYYSPDRPKSPEPSSLFCFGFSTHLVHDWCLVLFFSLVTSRGLYLGIVGVGQSL